MDSIRKNEIKRWFIYILTVFNIVAISTMLFIHFTKPKPLHNPHERHKRVMNFLIDELQLNPEQTTRFKHLRNEHFEYTKGIRKNIRHSKKRMFEEVASDKPNTTYIDSVALYIGVLQSQLEQRTAHHFLSLKSLLNSDQSTQFDRIFKKIQRRERKPK